MPDWQDKLALISQRNRQEIVHAKLSKRDMLRMGLLTAGGTLALKSGLSSRALAQVTSRPTPPSPASLPWTQAMPLIPIQTEVNPRNMKFGYDGPDGTTPIDGATKRINHQLCSYDPVTGAYGGKFPPKKIYETVAAEGDHKFAPTWGNTKMWMFDGAYPGPRYMAKYGEPIMVRFHNRLPSKSKYVGFGIPEISTHLHNGHTPSESDGNPVNFFNSINDPNEINPYGFKDQHYPNVYAGYTALNDLRGDPREAMSSLWYHDHHIDFTAQNVVKGMVGVYNLFDELDCNDETKTSGGALRLPSGKYDVPIMFGDFIFDQNYQVVFDLFNTDGILCDKFAANGAIQPYFDVEKRRYRFRLYNHGPSRWYHFALFDGTNYFPFWQISNDGNLLPQALQKTGVSISVAERADIIIDFSKFNGRRLYLVNRQEQLNGRGPTNTLLNPGTPIVQFNIGAVPTTRDASVDPSLAPLFLRTLPDQDFGALMARANKAKQRTFRFERNNGAWTVNGKLFDQSVVAANPAMESEEVWTIQNPGGDWKHPVHIHFEEHRILSRNGVATPPTSTDYGRKDVIPLGWNEEVKVFMRFRDMKGRYVMHCHNVVHEDAGMMVRWDIT